MTSYRRVATLKTPSALAEHLAQIGVDLPCDDQVQTGADAPLAQPVRLPDGVLIGNRWAILPMEGWDGTLDGRPSELTFRRWQRFGASGAKLIWGGEAAAVRHDGRANPNQLLVNEATLGDLAALREALVAEHETQWPSSDLLIGLQLTHSGRYSNPDGDFQPKIFSDNPVLEEPVRAGLSAGLRPGFFSDSEIDVVKKAYIEGINLAEQAGFNAFDVKACHGYLLHEMLYAYDRTDSRYGGSYENRTRFLRDVLNTPSKIIKSMRLSAFDLIPYPHGFGMSPDGSQDIELSEVRKLITEFSPMVPLWNITAGVPRHAAHIGRPYDRGAFDSPPPGEHPLEGIARLIRITGKLQQSFPTLFFVGSGYSWLRQFYPNVGAGALNQGKASFIGLGRSSFAYPDTPKDLMQKGKLDVKKVCVSCSKCTEFMRLGGPTGCGVRDGRYKAGGQKGRRAESKESGN